MTITYPAKTYYDEQTEETFVIQYSIHYDPPDYTVKVIINGETLNFRRDFPQLKSAKSFVTKSLNRLAKKHTLIK